MMKFSQSHEWVKLNENIATVGISQYAQKELGHVVYVELPKIGTKIQAGQEAAVLESTKAATDIYSPLSGEVIEVNTHLEEVPDKINFSAENEGWLFKLKISQESEYKGLMDESTYRGLVL